MTDWLCKEVTADRNLTGPCYITDSTGRLMAEGLSRRVADEIVAAHNQRLEASSGSAPIRVYYNSQMWSRLRLSDAPALKPADFDGLVVLTDKALRTVDDVWACLNEDDRPGGRSFRSMCSGDVVILRSTVRCTNACHWGWRPVDSVAGEVVLRQRFGLPAQPQSGNHSQDFVAAFDAWSANPEVIGGPFDRVLAVREQLGYVPSVA